MTVEQRIFEAGRELVRAEQELNPKSPLKGPTLMLALKCYALALAVHREPRPAPQHKGARSNPSLFRGRKREAEKAQHTSQTRR
jgi:hypothetical protein